MRLCANIPAEAGEFEIVTLLNHRLPNRLYDTIPKKAAALAFSLVRNHAFVDGNKRIGHAGMEVFLTLNGFTVNAGVDEQEELNDDGYFGIIAVLRKIVDTRPFWEIESCWSVVANSSS